MKASVNPGFFTVYFGGFPFFTPKLSRQPGGYSYPVKMYTEVGIEKKWDEINRKLVIDSPCRFRKILLRTGSYENSL